MGELTNFEVYKIAGLSIEGYVFSIQEDNEEEPTYHYYMITISPNKQPVISKLNNTIEILSTNDIELVPVEPESKELARFISLVQSTMAAVPSLPGNQYLKGLNNKDIRLIKTQ